MSRGIPIREDMGSGVAVQMASEGETVAAPIVGVGLEEGGDIGVWRDERSTWSPEQKR
jgi:hypothetical protein